MTVNKIPSQIKIGIDIDNVISDSYPSYLARFNSLYKTTIKYEEISDFYYLEKFAGKAQKELAGFIDTLVVDESFQLTLPSYAGAKEVIRQWSCEGKRIHYITARPKAAYQVTYNWLLAKGFWTGGTTLDMFDDKHHTKDYEFKKEVVSKKAIDLMIEDSLIIAQALDIPVILFDRPWNQGKLNSNIHRLKSWSEAEEFVRKL